METVSMTAFLILSNKSGWREPSTWTKNGDPETFFGYRIHVGFLNQCLNPDLSIFSKNGIIWGTTWFGTIFLLVLHLGELSGFRIDARILKIGTNGEIK
jgi:hypothetical protein